MRKNLIKLEHHRKLSYIRIYGFRKVEQHMIVSFSVENWMSFQNEATFSMISTRERNHGERVPKIDKYSMRILPIAAIYGGNASGKTNFFRALNFVKWLIIRGTQPDAPIPVDPYRLDDACATQPSTFKIELLIDEVLYEYSFSVTNDAILKEKLVQVLSKKEVTLYDRNGEKISFNTSFEDQQFLNFVSKGTRKNQLFLTNSISQNVENFRNIYDWFRDKLELIAPDARFGPFERFLDESGMLYNKMNAIMPKLDTGISCIECEEIPFENIPLPNSAKLQLQETLKDGQTIRYFPSINDKFIITRKDGKLIAKKMMFVHKKSNGSVTNFDMGQESDGSLRVIDLLPAFLELSDPKANKVFVVDEIDRSLHTLLTKQLIDSYLAECSLDKRTQLLMTTHDLLLMDQKLFRRDEMWAAERSELGASNLISFSEYKDVRYDKDIRKSYLQGRLGGIPKVFIESSFTGNQYE
jgi:AAA15 family ATPase/GTPase